jgi:hypothetical protein
MNATGMENHGKYKNPHMLNGSLSPGHGATWGYGWKRLPPDIEGSCVVIY